MVFIDSFKLKYDFEQRKKVSQEILDKHTDRVPIIVDRVLNSNAPNIRTHRFLVPRNITLGKFIYEIRKHIDIRPDQAIFVFIKDRLPATSALIDQLYTANADEDGFLYLLYSGESVFGTI